MYSIFAVFGFRLVSVVLQPIPRWCISCNVNQPALSIQTTKFEEEPGVQLLVRGDREFFFTPAGEAVLNRARTIMRQVTKIEELAELRRGLMLELVDDLSRDYGHKKSGP